MQTIEQRLALATDLLAKAQGYVHSHGLSIGGQKLADDIKAFVHNERVALPEHQNTCHCSEACGTYPSCAATRKRNTADA